MLIARGDAQLDEIGLDVKSPLDGVSDSQWSRFVRAITTADVSSVSASNALGMFELTPRRLADLGLVSRLQRSRSPDGKTIWVAAFRPPLSCEKFLQSPSIQYRVLAESMRDYARKISHPYVADSDVTLSGALALLHRSGPSGLQNWATGKRFADTARIFNRANGIF